jgi:hypothetical protein
MSEFLRVIAKSIYYKQQQENSDASQISTLQNNQGIFIVHTLVKIIYHSLSFLKSYTPYFLIF